MATPRNFDNRFLTFAVSIYLVFEAAFEQKAVQSCYIFLSIVDIGEKPNPIKQRSNLVGAIFKLF